MIDPIAFKIGPLAVRWYGIAYEISLIVSVGILIQMNKKRPVFKNSQQIIDFLFWLFSVGVLFGGRLGYVLFYNLPYYLDNPLKIFAVWEGGMSFHGGMIASVLLALYLGKKHKINLLAMGDMMAVVGGLVTFWTRIANFINQELVGRVIQNENWKWMGFDFGDGFLRYPSQLFQSAGSLVLFIILLVIWIRTRKKGVVTFSYFFFYGLIRFVLEFWREPDSQIGFLFKYFTLGQLLSFGMLIVGAIGLFYLWILDRNLTET